MEEINQNQFLDEAVSRLLNIEGIDYICFVDKNCNVIREQQINNTNNYLQEVLNIIKLESLFDKLSTNFYANPFHTCTLLNENGLIIISKLHNHKDLYTIIIAGENKPVDLINLLKMCKEFRSGFAVI